MLALNVFTVWDLYTLTLQDGTIFRWTDCAYNLVVGGSTFLAAGSAGVPTVKRGRTKQSIGLQVDTLDITLGVNETVLYGSIPIAQAAALGKFRSGRALVQRLFLDTATGAQANPLHWFEGRIAEPTITTTQIKLPVKSELETLTQRLPHQVIQPQCTRALFDAGCTLLLSDYLQTAAVTASGPNSASLVYSASSIKKKVGSVDPAPTGWFNLGVLKVTSGVNAGLVRAITDHVYNLGGDLCHRFTLDRALPVACGGGDTFEVRPGCDKAMTTCSTKYVNLPNFRGHPHVPTSETAR